MALERIESELLNLERLYASRLYEYQDMAIRRIRKLVAEGAGLNKIVELNQDGFFGYGKRAKSELVDLRERIADFGRGQVQDEIKRQA